ncbi:unnamed protein product [Onchocerca flexuosa]|uniref:DUF2281 domain-containing protein n=1 Tax=Onchocerca flexuosa TaxID=387005 RepID=A0A183HVV0_9BILA|nr:unnamed protein product [Onchocerca flexuosa]
MEVKLSREQITDDELAEIFRTQRQSNEFLLFLNEQPEFHVPANKELNRRIKVRFIDNSEKLDMEEHQPFNAIDSSDFEKVNIYF